VIQVNAIVHFCCPCAFTRSFTIAESSLKKLDNLKQKLESSPTTIVVLRKQRELLVKSVSSPPDGDMAGFAVAFASQVADLKRAWESAVDETIGTAKEAENAAGEADVAGAAMAAFEFAKLGQGMWSELRLLLTAVKRMQQSLAAEKGGESEATTAVAKEALEALKALAESKKAELKESLAQTPSLVAQLRHARKALVECASVVEDSSKLEEKAVALAWVWLEVVEAMQGVANDTQSEDFACAANALLTLVRLSYGLKTEFDFLLQLSSSKAYHFFSSRNNKSNDPAAEDEEKKTMVKRTKNALQDALKCAAVTELQHLVQKHFEDKTFGPDYAKHQILRLKDQAARGQNEEHFEDLNCEIAALCFSAFSNVCGPDEFLINTLECVEDLMTSVPLVGGAIKVVVSIVGLYVKSLKGDIAAKCLANRVLSVGALLVEMRKSLEVEKEVKMMEKVLKTAEGEIEKWLKTCEKKFSRTRKVLRCAFGGDVFKKIDEQMTKQISELTAKYAVSIGGALGAEIETVQKAQEKQYNEVAQLRAELIELRATSNVIQEDQIEALAARFGVEDLGAELDAGLNKISGLGLAIQNIESETAVHLKSMDERMDVLEEELANLQGKFSDVDERMDALEDWKKSVEELLKKEVPQSAGKESLSEDQVQRAKHILAYAYYGAGFCFFRLRNYAEAKVYFETAFGENDRAVKNIGPNLHNRSSTEMRRQGCLRQWAKEFRTRLVEVSSWMQSKAWKLPLASISSYQACLTQLQTNHADSLHIARMP
jgi:hypothetical protein